MFTWHWIDSSICSIAQHLRPPELCDTERRSTGKYVFAPDVHGVAVLSEVWSRCRGNAPPDSVTTSWSSRCCWHQRRSSGVKLGSLAPLRSVCWDKQSAGRRRRRRRKKTLLWNTSATAGYSPLSTPLWIYAPLKEEEYLCAWVQLVLVVISALSPERSFRISAHCFWKIFSASVRIFPLFLSRVCDNLQPTISSFSKILQPQLDHGHTQITR